MVLAVGKPPMDIVANKFHAGMGARDRVAADRECNHSAADGLA
jgi:hypothetical protein